MVWNLAGTVRLLHKEIISAAVQQILVLPRQNERKIHGQSDTEHQNMKLDKFMWTTQISRTIEKTTKRKNHKRTVRFSDGFGRGNR